MEMEIKLIKEKNIAKYKSFKDSLILGDSYSVLNKLPKNIAQMIVTSPPYFGHRKYDNSGKFENLEIGREKKVEDYVSNLSEILGKAREVIKKNGTLWLNLGDTYVSGELQGIPWRVVFALKKKGWILRSEIIWNKPNAMPSSVKIRPTTSHEHIFLFSKSFKYLYDSDAIREPHVTFSEKSKMKGGRSHLGKRGGTPEKGKFAGHSNLHNGRWDQAFHPKGRNKRTVWEIPLGKCREAHFAVFPEKLIRDCIKAGSQAGDIILDPFMGAGTTAITSKRLGRNFLGIELIPHYVDTCLKRIPDELSKDIKLEHTYKVYTGTDKEDKRDTQINGNFKFI